MNLKDETRKKKRFTSLLCVYWKMYITSHLKWINKKSCARSEILFFPLNTHDEIQNFNCIGKFLFGFSNFKWADTEVKSSLTSLSRYLSLFLLGFIILYLSIPTIITHFRYLYFIQTTLPRYGINTILRVQSLVMFIKHIGKQIGKQKQIKPVGQDWENIKLQCSEYRFLLHKFINYNEYISNY